MKIDLEPIGIVHSPYKTLAAAPPQDGEDISTIEIFGKYEAGLKDIDGFSHLNVLYHLHLSRGWDLRITTPWDTRLHGLFTTRSPRRPSPIGYAAVELLERKDNLLRVRGLDAVEGTPVLDIKPYIPAIDSWPEAAVGWLEGRLFSRKR